MVSRNCLENNVEATGLTDGATYKFRVKAKNDVGFTSEALESELVLIKGVSGMYKRQTILLECVSLQA